MQFISRVLLMPFLVISHNVGSVELYDLEDFEIYGMKLGDQGEQVVEKFMEHFSITREDLTIDDFGKGIEYVEYRNDDIQVRAWIEEDTDSATGQSVPDSPRKLDLLWINWWNDDYMALGREITDKYGPPSAPGDLPSEKDLPADMPVEVLWEFGQFWCEQLNESKDKCEDGTPALLIHSHSVNGSKGRAILVKNYE